MFYVGQDFSSASSSGGFIFDSWQELKFDIIDNVNNNSFPLILVILSQYLTAENKILPCQYTVSQVMWFR